MLSAACYEHHHILSNPSRLSEFADALLGEFDRGGGVVYAWVILPNHWHVLAEVNLDVIRKLVAKLHNGKSTQWNREDAEPGRKVWHRFSDRQIRNERHGYATLNYIHANPVKHGYVKDARAWPWSSLHKYLHDFGRDRLRQWWSEYPVGDYGRGWDE